MSNDPKASENFQRQAFRKTVHRIWSMIQAGLSDEMDEAESKIARILLEHTEFEEIFDDEDLLDGREFDTGSEGNPFLHISFHKMVEDQIGVGRPAELLSFLAAMEAKGFDRHEIVHAVMKILIRLISDAMAHQKPLDVNRYRRLLQRYRNIGLDEISDALNRELMSN
jgi:hypothetical protein